MSYICYAIVFLIEAIISIFYFEAKFERKVNIHTLLIFISFSCILSFIVSTFNIPIINAIIFFITNLLLSILCYSTNIRACIFSNLMLLTFMIVTEVIVFYSSYFTFGVDLDSCFTDSFILIMQATITKLLYFFTVYISTRLSTKEKTGESIFMPVLLSILPVASIILMHTTIYICLSYNINDQFKLSLTICNVLILLSNILVFYVHELTIKTNRKYTQLVLEQQKENNRFEYYKLLQEQNENSRILMHDITRHLNALQQLASNNSDVGEYVNNIVKDFNINNPINYCNNYLVNLITHRYCEICEKKKIKIYTNIRDTKINFMSESDITALIDNLLENAVESAESTDEKLIEFSICVKNDNLLVIKISNSCSKKPHQHNGKLITSKFKTSLHGIGIVSIKRVVNKYNGDIQMRFDEQTKKFESTIIFTITNESDSEIV